MFYERNVNKKIYPSGVVLPFSQSEIDNRPPRLSSNEAVHYHEEVESLIKQVESRVAKNIELEDIQALAKIGMKCGFGNTLTFRAINQKNSLLRDRYREFVIDTLNFIGGQPRAYSLYTWRTLLGQASDYGEVHWADEKTGKIADESLLPAVEKNTDHSTYVSQWLARENGFEDMLYSFAILFGNHLDCRPRY